MDPKRFDQVARTLAQAGTRRGVVRLLAVLPVAGALSALLWDDTEAKGRHKRRTKRNKRHSGNDKNHRKGKSKGKRKGKRAGDDTGTNKGTPAFEPASLPPAGCTPTTCAAQGTTCGRIADGCGGTLNCGPCTAFPNSYCDTTTGSCACDADCAGKAGGADDECGGTCDAGCFGAPCTSNEACASGICACIARDCSGGGLCGDAFIQEKCLTGSATVATPGGGVSSVCVFGSHPSLWTACGTCTGLQICQIDRNRDICLILRDM